MSAFQGGFGQRAAATAVMTALLMTGLGGCKSQEDADAAAEQMTKTAATLSAYYDAMDKLVGAEEDTFVAQDALDAAYQNVKSGGAAEILPSLEETRKQLRLRKSMADDVVKIAACFSQVDKSTAGKDTKTAAGKLDAALVSAKALANNSAATAAIMQGTQELMVLVQEHQEVAAAKKVAPLTQKLSEFFDSETEAYDSLNATYLATAKTVSTTLVDHSQVDTSAVFASALQPFGLTPAIDQAKLKSGMKAYEQHKIEDGYEAKLKSEKAATQAMSDALKEMNKRIGAVAADQPMKLRFEPVTLKSVVMWAEAQLKGAQ